MSEEKIKDILKTRFTSYQVHETTPLEWDKLESRLEEKRFFKFAYNRFNVYYLGFIAVYGVITTCLTTLYVKEHFTGHEISTSVQLEQKNYASSTTLDDLEEGISDLDNGMERKNVVLNKTSTIGIGVENAGTSSLVNASLGMGSHEDDSMDLGTLSENTQFNAKKDSLKLVAESNRDVKHRLPPVTIMLKQDTIKKYDTVFVYKKKKKFRF